MKNENLESYERAIHPRDMKKGDFVSGYIVEGLLKRTFEPFAIVRVAENPDGWWKAYDYANEFLQLSDREMCVIDERISGVEFKSFMKQIQDEMKGVTNG